MRGGYPPASHTPLVGRGGGGVFLGPTPRAGVALTRLVTRAMVARPFRPLLLAMMSGTDDYELPSYATDSADRR